MTRFAGIEAGGTTWVVSIAEGDPSNIVERAEFPTATPQLVLAQVVAWLKPKKFDCLGIASFGPVDLDPSSPKYGYITTTPKLAWRDADVVGGVVKGLGLPPDFPVGFDTDVNAPALAEYAQAQEKGEKIGSCAYVTVGTGVGIGLVFNGEMLHGLLHGEGGHISVPPYPGEESEKMSFSLKCPKWVELESSCNSAALAKRAQCPVQGLKDLPDDHPVWDVAAHYLACMCANMILMASPEKIVLSGGVLLRKILFPKIRAKTKEYLNGYIDVPKVVTMEGLEKLIVPSDHGNRAGIIGALFLGQNELNKRKKKADAAPSAFIPLVAGVALGAALALLFARPK
eukprot:CAMPEP_0172611016 /NCGR_PEP_ID=MMETSP1068-20121228/30751_1 /TAXON_ID=35684 /ORGANISM="Pseudopedinella elastica, Strain CCMP716" /LENGTH=341 /DNA_ID=CAMNT_0013414873 /DNA_START=47 /DNA_END=1072 /DNA_ORIENTATION=+